MNRKLGKVRITDVPKTIDLLRTLGQLREIYDYCMCVFVYVSMSFSSLRIIIIV